MTAPDFGRARAFLLTNARLLERQLFAFHFEGGSREAVLRAVQAYRHETGLYGYGLEPDKRAAAPQPVDQAVALEILDDIGAEQGEFETVCDGLHLLTAPEGGLPFSHPSVQEAPRAPWWECPEPQPASINPTGNILAFLWKNGLSHPWMAAAEAFCWRALDQLSSEHPHALANALAFLEQVPDRARAEAAMARLGDLVRDAVSFDPEAPGYVFSPLSFAPTPASPAARFFTEGELRPHLEKMAGGQQEDGGWPINWSALSKGVETEGRGIVTLRNLRVLNAYGMLALR